MSTKLILTLTLLTLPSAAVAQETIKQKEGWAEYAQMLTEKVEQVNERCGGKLTAAFDKSTYTDFDPLKDRTQAACRDVMYALTAVCATDAGKEGVRSVKHVTCRFSSTRTGLSMAGSTLVVDISPAHSSIVGKEKGGYSWQSAVKELL